MSQAKNKGLLFGDRSGGACTSRGGALGGGGGEQAQVTEDLFEQDNERQISALRDKVGWCPCVHGERGLTA